MPHPNMSVSAEDMDYWTTYNSELGSLETEGEVRQLCTLEHIKVGSCAYPVGNMTIVYRMTIYIFMESWLWLSVSWGLCSMLRISLC